MILKLNRIAKKATYTIGRLYEVTEGGGERYLCDTLEPAWRDYAHGEVKIPGLSAIPEGEYTVVITWSPKFREWLPQIIGDQAFNRQWQGVRIHAGNTAADTRGCILPGENKIPGRVINSRRCLRMIVTRLTEAYARGGECEVKDRDPLNPPIGGLSKRHDLQLSSDFCDCALFLIGFKSCCKDSEKR